MCPKNSFITPRKILAFLEQPDCLLFLAITASEVWSFGLTVLHWFPRLELMLFLSSESTHLQISMSLVWQPAQSFSHLPVSVLQDGQSQPSKLVAKQGARERHRDAWLPFLLAQCVYYVDQPLTSHPSSRASPIPCVYKSLLEILLCSALCWVLKIFYPIGSRHNSKM